MKLINQARKGDIIRAEAFAFGTYALPLDLETRTFTIDKQHITVDGKTRNHPVEAGGRVVELGAYDSSRGKALFLVERAESEGGQKGTRMNNYDFYPNGWHVFARRLNSNGTYNPKNERIEFYQHECFNYFIPEVEFVGIFKKDRLKNQKNLRRL